MRLILALLAGLASPALADAPFVTGGLSLGLSTDADPGARQTAGLHVEAEWTGFYAGLSFDAYKDPVLNEADLSLGYRTILGPIDVDASYTRYIYPGDGGDCCGGLDLTLGAPIGPLRGELELGYDPDTREADQSLTLSWARPVGESLTVTPSYTLSQEAGDQWSEWEIRADYALGATSGLSLYLDDGSDYDPYVGVDLTWDVTLFGG